MTGVDTVPVDEIRRELSFDEQISFASEWRTRPLREWVMDADDATLRYLFRNFRPRRHLEFGTWQGDGVLRCVEECDATVWTINVLEGEARPDGGWAYGELETAESDPPTPWSERLSTNDGVWARTDSYGQIGRKYLKAGWGKRVCQIYADSRDWDTRAYPDGFFDTAFIDGGHAADVVENDTRQAVRLVRAGGLVIWHDFCPLEEVTRQCESTRDVVGFITAHLEELRGSFTRLFWVEPSWLLFGIRSN
jgi:Methyltransferase domain